MSKPRTTERNSHDQTNNEDHRAVNRDEREYLSATPWPSHEPELTAAAEALPQVIEQATAEKLSLTAALARLLEIEVTTAKARRLTGRLRFA